MKILKYFSDGEWVSLLKNALDKRKNLSDLYDKEEARKNLELSGDIETHYHDSRYYTETEIDNKIKELNKRIENLENTSLQKIGDLLSTISIQENEPNTKKTNHVWICTLKDNLKIQLYDGSKWNLLSGKEIAKININLSDWVKNNSAYKVEKTVNKNFSTIAFYKKNGSNYECVLGIDKITISSEGKLIIESEDPFEGFVSLSYI